MPGNTDATGAAIMPANAASATPSANTSRYSRLNIDAQRLHHLAVGAACADHHPSRVLWISRYMAAASTRQTADIHRR